MKEAAALKKTLLRPSKQKEKAGFYGATLERIQEAMEVAD